MAEEYEQADMEDPDMEEQNVYKEGAREDLVDNDQISPEEEGFMSGYDRDEEKSDDDEDIDD